MSFFANLLGGGIVESVEKIALEAIDTDLESAEAKSLFVKTLDPNGAMRRQISRDVTNLFRLYMYTMMALLAAQAFELGNIVGVEKAIINLVDLFLPITGAFTAIVSASFGVNVSNNWKDTKAK